MSTLAHSWMCTELANMPYAYLQVFRWSTVFWSSDADMTRFDLIFFVIFLLQFCLRRRPVKKEFNLLENPNQKMRKKRKQTRGINAQPTTNMMMARREGNTTAGTAQCTPRQIQHWQHFLFWSSLFYRINFEANLQTVNWFTFNAHEYISSTRRLFCGDGYAINWCFQTSLRDELTAKTISLP